VERLREDYDVFGYFYNPNIQPREEYDRRVETLRTLATEIELPLFVDEYDVDRWLAMVKGLEDAPEGGERCEICFRMRLQKTIEYALENDFDLLTATLTVSPRKNAELINNIGKELAESAGIRYLESNFKKKNGFGRSVELSKKYKLYRQNYCGCIFSKR
jgi:predicted adenine nucleotide alpha hydrolase (AANH) superfamily ATPase